MIANYPVTIERVANGFIVRREFQRRNDNAAYAVPIVDGDTHVFETFGNLTSWLNVHFPDDELQQDDVVK